MVLHLRAQLVLIIAVFHSYISVAPQPSSAADLTGSPAAPLADAILHIQQVHSISHQHGEHAQQAKTAGGLAAARALATLRPMQQPPSSRLCPPQTALLHPFPILQDEEQQPEQQPGVEQAMSAKRGRKAQRQPHGAGAEQQAQPGEDGHASGQQPPGGESGEGQQQLLDAFQGLPGLVEALRRFHCEAVDATSFLQPSSSISDAARQAAKVGRVFSLCEYVCVCVIAYVEGGGEGRWRQAACQQSACLG